MVTAGQSAGVDLVTKTKRLLLNIGMAASILARLPATVPEYAPLFTRIAQATVIPAEVSGHGMYVSVLINGQGPFRMQIDTGCSISIISPEVAAAVEARGVETNDDDAPVVNGLGDILTMPRVLLDSVGIGGVQFQGVVVGVVPLELQSKLDSRALDGLLGYSLFADLFFALDFPNQNLVLSDDRPKDLPPIRAEFAVTEHSEVPFIAVKLQGKEVSVMVDTGSNDRLHLPPDDLTGLQWKVEPRPGFLLAVAGEAGREQIGRLAGTLELDRLRLAEPVVGISDGPPTVGLGLLHTFCLVFHESEDKFWLCAAEAGPLPSPPERSVGLSLFADPDGWRVAGIIPHSPAEAAAIQEGDVVTQIEGQPAHSWTRGQIQAWIDTHPTLNLQLSAAAGVRNVGLRVWELVP